MSAILVSIPGEPCAQGRGRAVGFRRGDGSIGARVFDPAKSRNWKAAAQDHMREAVIKQVVMPQKNGCFHGPVQLHVVAVFTLAKSHWRKREPVPMQWHTGRPDADNLLKAVKDAAKGVLWLDDSQVCDERCQKVLGAQGQAPGVYLGAQPMPTFDDEHLNYMPLAGHVWSMIEVATEPGKISGDMSL